MWLGGYAPGSPMTRKFHFSKRQHAGLSFLQDISHTVESDIRNIVPLPCSNTRHRVFLRIKSLRMEMAATHHLITILTFSYRIVSNVQLTIPNCVKTLLYGNQTLSGLWSPYGIIPVHFQASYTVLLFPGISSWTCPDIFLIQFLFPKCFSPRFMNSRPFLLLQHQLKCHLFRKSLLETLCGIFSYPLLFPDNTICFH